MTSVGTPIYVAPEVMSGNRYDATADSYSFGICLVAMIRAEKDVMEFYFQALRKDMKRKTKKGVGVAILNNKMYSKGWRPLLPLEFERSYPKLCKILKRCWAQKPEDRPSFDEVVRVMQGEVTEEVLLKEEPEVVVYSKEDDKVYWERMGKDEHFEEEGEGYATTTNFDTSQFVSKRELEKAVEEAVRQKDAMIAEMKKNWEVKRGEVVGRHDFDIVVKQLEELQKDYEAKEEEIEELKQKKTMN